MFTGLIEEIGQIKSVRNIGGGKRISVNAKMVMDDVKIDDSIAIDGVCQTVVAYGDDYFEVEAVEETLKKTTLKYINIGKPVNLERAMKLGDRMGGHIVQGHVDCEGKILSIQKQATGILVWISYDAKFDKYVIPVGSISIDGISLTVAQKDHSKLMVSVIPHTWNITTLAMRGIGDSINLEFDVIGKYVENMVAPHANPTQKPKTSMWDKYIDQPDW